ncbi:mitogen-activated protein kinase kinase kinase 5 isoform X1 [Ricinus communis]|uniref:mitogen-activated protein kinase kinase kinase 5 isoform X1 n=1 Tax=Ricinus communis TaxID=3988 RepID=UPI00201AA2BF|nr:mitogen-activated protein kinase kinase kinase 5 isoform X1 [Ricinus communis]
MLYFPKTSSSSPSSPPVSANNTKRLTRQRKIRHETQQDLGLQFSQDRLNSPPASPDSARKPRSPPCSSSSSSPALPQPLPLPESHFTRRPEPFGFIPGHAVPASPEERPIYLLRRNSADQVDINSATGSSNFQWRFSPQDPNVDTANHGLRLNIAPRSAPSSPLVSPRRSNAGEFSTTFNAADSTKCSKTCCKGQLNDLNIECVNYKLSWIDSPRSAPTSGFSSPNVSPQRSYTIDFLPSFVAREVPDLGRHAGHTSRKSLVKTGNGLDRSAIYPSQQSPTPNKKPPHKFSFQLHNKMFVGKSKEWPETNSQFSAHPLPLPPGAASPQSFIPSPPAILHHTIEKPNVSLRKTQWLKGKLIGRGTYGSVYVGTNRETGALCAMKEVDIIPGDSKSVECIKQLEQEIRLLQHLEHPNIVQYYSCEIVDDHFYIYLEYVYPGSISKYVREHCGAMTESIVRNFTRHILSGLAYLHSKKTIHRDIKGANLLVNSSGIVKLADFGMAKHLSGLSYELSLKGSPHWMAPEVIQAVMQNNANPDLALAVDIWSLGCTIIEMFTGKPPWGELEGPQAMFKALNKTPPIPEAMSPEAKDFLCCCLRRNPAERPSASMLLEHPFLRNSSELNLSTCPLSLKNLTEKIQSSRDCAA